ncbi:MAG: CPBP family intramembrane metalloprotease [Acidimicrobiales bacterium]|nr:CPBP family intramembrane metalloprotease [Acidimicrobiales bacterium]
MRVKPSALSAIAAILGYLVVVFSVWGITGLEYDEVGDTVESVRKGIVLSIGAGAAYLAAVTTILGWWKPALHEPRRVGGRWMMLIPALLALGAIGNLATTKWGEIDGVASYVLWLAIGTLLVGFSEELLTRGIAIVGGRGSMHERWVWVFSGAIFGLLHAPNALFGQSLPETMQQIVFAFAVGLMYYVTRRITGALVVTMGLHAIWDFSIFIQAHSTQNLADKPIAAGGLVLNVTVILGIVALVKILRAGDVVEPGGDQLAEFDRAA